MSSEEDKKAREFQAWLLHYLWILQLREALASKLPEGVFEKLVEIWNKDEEEE